MVRDWEWCLMNQRAVRLEYVPDFILWIILNFLVITWRCYPIIILNTIWNSLGNCGSFDYFLGECCVNSLAGWMLQSKWELWFEVISMGGDHYDVYSKQSYVTIKKNLL